MTYDVIIIGAGMSGLAAGMRLAYYEKKVCILEQHDRPGGLNSYYTLDGRKFDVGLHAITNFVKKGVKNCPLSKILRQLRLKYEDFDLREQNYSQISFPDKSLSFDNNFETFEKDIKEKFPSQYQNFIRLCQYIKDFDALNLKAKPTSSREVIKSFIDDPLLIEMIYCPLSFYGSAKEYDMDMDQFVIMFRSIFFEGFARPWEGVRKIIPSLVKRYRSYGGELKFNSGVKSINTKNGKVVSVTLQNGETLNTKTIISSIGSNETMALTGEDVSDERIGKLSFIETIYCLNKEPSQIGIDQTIVFYNDRKRFEYRKPIEGVDLSSGVICCPNNFKFEKPLPEGMIRVTNLANFEYWENLSANDYKNKKKEWQEKSLEKVCRIIPDFSSSIVGSDMFTPKTIKRYTGHLGGAVYGSPSKIKDGKTKIENLYICGTDQGFMGIIGAMLSGISIANLYGLK